ncbi:MAG: NPCBM/NEW2 domain-containing protein [Candidatus Acidiferrum sp.]
MKRIAIIGLFFCHQVAFAVNGASSPSVVVRTTNGTELRGVLQSLKSDGTLSVAVDSKAQQIAGDNVVTLRQVAQKLPPFPVGEQAVLVNGDRFPVEGVGLEGDKLRMRGALFGKAIQLPLAAVAVWWRTAPDDVELPDRFLRRLATKDRRRDLVHLRNGDVLEGVLEAIDQGKIQIEVNKKSVTAKLNQVAAVAPASESTNALAHKGFAILLTLTNGVRLTLASAASADGVQLDAVTVFGAKIHVPLMEVAALDYLNDGIVYLSDLKSVSGNEAAPYLGTDSFPWPVVANANVMERDMRLAGSTYAKGLGLHSPARVRYALNGSFRRFEARVGLDDVTGRRGSVRIRVLGDGKPLHIGFDQELTAKNGPIKVRANVAGVKELTLQVDCGRGGDVQDHVNWAGAKVIR